MPKYKIVTVCLENCIYRHKKEKPKLKKYTNIFDITIKGFYIDI